MKQKKEIHVLYILTKLELGGAQKVCLSLLNGLQNFHVKTWLISGAEGELVSTVKNSPNVILIDQFKRNVSIFSIFTELRCFIKLISSIRKYKQQYKNIIVHTHSTKAGILGRWAAFFAGVKIRIHTIHGYAFHNHQNKLIWSLIYMAELITSFITTHYVCVSSKDVKIGIRVFPRFSKKHSIIRAAIEWDNFYIPAYQGNQFPSSHETFIFGTTSCFKKQKNLFDLLHAFEVVHQNNPHTRLELIGDGTLRNRIESWIKEHNLGKSIVLHGWQKNVKPIVMNWHAFVLSSLWEGLPCAVIEARLLKLPVLSYNTGGIHDVIIHGENGLLFKQGDWQELSRGMLLISRDQKLYTTLQSYTDELHDFKDKQMVQQHINLYKMF